MEKNKNYESGKLYNGLKMTLDNDKNCIILRTRADLKNIDRTLIFHLANCFIEEIECKAKVEKNAEELRKIRNKEVKA